MTNQSDAFAQARAELKVPNSPTTEAIRQLRTLLIAGRVPTKNREFVESLLRSADGRNGLSLKQAEWVGKLVERFSQPVVEKPKIELRNVKGVINLLNRAKDNGLKFPKLWLKILPNEVQYESGWKNPVIKDFPDLRITVAGEQSKNPGCLTLTNGEKYGSPDNRYWGRISPEGEFTLGRDGEAIKDRLINLLNRLADDPAKVAAEFGHLTGHCCFCSKHLTDERSTAVGYGSTCAEKFGLPWG